MHRKDFVRQEQRRSKNKTLSNVAPATDTAATATATATSASTTTRKRPFRDMKKKSFPFQSLSEKNKKGEIEQKDENGEERRKTGKKRKICEGTYEVPKSLQKSTRVVEAGKDVSEVFKENLAKTMAKTFAEHIVSMADDIRKSKRKEEMEDDDDDDDDDEEEEEEEEEISEEEISDEERGTKVEKNDSRDLDLIDNIVDGKYFNNTLRKQKIMGTGGRKRGGARGRFCPAKITAWLKSAEDAFRKFADFILTVKISSDEENVLADLYRRDLRKTVAAVMKRQILFENASPIARGLARFDMHINLLSSDRISVLDSSMAVELENSRHCSPLKAISTFKILTKELLCSRVKNLLGHLHPEVAPLIFNDVVEYVKGSVDFFNKWGDLPGMEFRSLLVDVNIRIMEMALSDLNSSTSKASSNFLEGSNKISSSQSTTQEDRRIMMTALQKIKDWKPISKDHHFKIDKAKDVILIPDTGNVGKIPVRPVELLKLASFVNALLILELRHIFTGGFFNAACVLISQCLSAGLDAYRDNSSLIRPSELAARVARDNLLRLHVIKKSVRADARNKKGFKEIAASTTSEEPETDEPYSSSSSSFSSSSEGKNKTGEKKKKIHVRKKRGGLRQRRRKRTTKDENEGELTAFQNLVHDTGGFFLDTSDFGIKIRKMIDSKNFEGLASYSLNLMESGSKIAVHMLVSSLMDYIIRKNEQYEEFERSCSCLASNKKNREGIITFKRKILDVSEVVKMLSGSQTDKNEIAKYFLREKNPSLVPKHEAFVLTEKLLPSRNGTKMETLIVSFFKKGNGKIKTAEGDEEERENEDEYKRGEEEKTGRRGCRGGTPDLLKVIKELFAEMSRDVLSVFDQASSKTRDLDTFSKLFSPTSSALRLRERVTSAFAIEYGETTPRKIFYPSEGTSENLAFGLKLTALSKYIAESREVEDIRHNALDLSDQRKSALSIMLFPPSSDMTTNANEEEEGEGESCSMNSKDEEIILSSKLAKGLFSIAQGCVAIVRSMDGEEIKGGSGGRVFALILDAHTMEEVVNYAADVLEKAAAEAIYADDEMRPSKVMEGIVSMRGVLSSVLDKRENATHIKDYCTEPSAVGKYAMKSVATRYLRQLKKRQQNFYDNSNNNNTPSQEEAAVDRALVEEIGDGYTDIVRAQMANAMGIAAISSIAIKMLEADSNEMESKLASNTNANININNINNDESQEAVLKSNGNLRSNAIKRIWMMKNLAHLCISVAVAAAADMTRLFNHHFFDSLHEVNDPTPGIRKRGVEMIGETEIKEREQEIEGNINNYDILHEIPSLSKKTAHTLKFKSVSPSADSTGKGWLHSAINAIAGIQGEQIINEFNKKSSDHGKLQKESKESILKKLSQITL